MRKVLAVIMLIGLGALLFWYTGGKMKENKEYVPTAEFMEIMNQDLDNNYPETAEEVVQVYSDISKYMYEAKEDKQGFIEHELSQLLLQQRILYDQQLLQLNEFEVHEQKAKNEINSFNESEYFITDSKILEPEYLPRKDEDGRKMAKVKVVYYTNTPVKIYMEYGLRQSSGQWKILGFSKVDEFTIPEA